MAKKDNKKNEKKKEGSGCLKGILIIIMIIIMLGLGVLATLNGILDLIKGVVTGIVDGTLDFLAHPFKNTISGLYKMDNFMSGLVNQKFDGHGLELTQNKQLVIINQEDFEKMAASLEQSISRNIAGLDDIMLKKILLAYNMGNYSKDADIIIELDEDEYNAAKKDPTLYKPFDICKGNDIKQFELPSNIVENTAGGFKLVTNAILDFLSGKNAVENAKAEIEDINKKINKYYLKANGILNFVNEDNEKLVYYNEEVLKKLYEDHYLAKVDTRNPDYAESVWKYLGKCYTDGTNGIKMYSHEKIEETVTNWEFRDDELIDGIKINRLTNLDVSKTRELQNIEYYSLVSEYATPLEFMVNLMEITSSKDFLNSFIEKVANETEITIKVYKTGYSQCEETTEEIKETTRITAEAKVDVEIKEVYKEFTDEEGKTKHKWTTDGIEELKVECSIEDVDGVVDKINRIVTITNVPEDVECVRLKLHKGEGDYETKTIREVKIDEDDNRYFEFSDKESFMDKYKEKDNECKIYQVTTTLSSEFKNDISLENVKTWYATMTFNNTKRTDTTYETLNEDGKIVSTEKDSPIMVSTSKDSEIYIKDESNKDTIFNEESTVAGLVLGNVGNKLDDWYSNLTSDNIFYYTTGGPLTDLVYKWLKEDEGNKISEIEECINIKLTYAVNEGILDEWFKDKYTPVKLESIYDEYKIGKMYTSISTSLEAGPRTVEDNSELFLSLLRNNNNGVYSDKAKYDPTGKNVKYDSVYGGEVKVGELLLSGEEIMYELLESSQNTQGLTIVMKTIMDKYKTGSSSTIDWDFNIYELNDSTSIIGDTLEEKLWCTLRNQGLSEIAVAAIIGNIYGNPDFNENELTDTSKEAIGLLQWTGPRKIGLISYAKEKGIKDVNINIQIEYLLGEITELGGCRGHAIYQLKDVVYDKEYTVDDWKKAEDIETATKSFYYIFNQPEEALSDFTTRINKSTMYYNKYEGKTIEDITGINQKQLSIAEIAANSEEYGIKAKEGYCLGWVNDVYEAAGVTVERKDCAYCSGHFFGVSKDFSIIPTGAAVYGESSSAAGKIYGHVGIYLGDGKVADNLGYVRITTLDKWRENYPNGCWGWTSSTPVNSNYPVIKGLIHAGRHD